MALLFSAVTITANDDATDLLVAGIPEGYDDLEGWTLFDDFMNTVDSDSEVRIHVEAYVYGEGETEKASPSEIAYIMERMECDPAFLSDHCDNIEDADFRFMWSPDEAFHMDME